MWTCANFFVLLLFVTYFLDIQKLEKISYFMEKKFDEFAFRIIKVSSKWTFDTRHNPQKSKILKWKFFLPEIRIPPKFYVKIMKMRSVLRFKISFNIKLIFLLKKMWQNNNKKDKKMHLMLKEILNRKTGFIFVIFT